MVFINKTEWTPAEQKRKKKKRKKNYTQNITLHVCRLRKVLRVYGIKVWEPARLIVTSNNCHRVSFCKLILLKRRPNFIYIFDIFISLLRIKRSKKKLQDVNYCMVTHAACWLASQPARPQYTVYIRSQL